MVDEREDQEEEGSVAVGKQTQARDSLSGPRATDPVKMFTHVNISTFTLAGDTLGLILISHSHPWVFMNAFQPYQSSERVSGHDDDSKVRDFIDNQYSQPFPRTAHMQTVGRLPAHW
jgi:hypothetical protein